jgi:hypothetical protein
MCVGGSVIMCERNLNNIEHLFVAIEIRLLLLLRLLVVTVYGAVAAVIGGQVASQAGSNIEQEERKNDCQQHY